MLKALIFDFDGVILDTEMLWYSMYRDWLKKEHHFDLNLKDYLVCVGSNNEYLFHFIEEKLGKNTGIREFEKRARLHFVEEIDTLAPMPGVVNVIKQAKQYGLKLAIATSATRKKPETQLKRLGLYDYFDVFSTAELIDHIKPEPDLFLKAVELLQLKNNECLAIEDSQNGMVSAVRAKVPCLIVPNKITENSDFTGCFKKINSLEEVNIPSLMDEYALYTKEGNG